MRAGAEVGVEIGAQVARELASGGSFVSFIYYVDICIFFPLKRNLVR